jgi:hypothetical protein
MNASKSKGKGQMKAVIEKSWNRESCSSMKGGGMKVGLGFLDQFSLLPLLNIYTTSSQPSLESSSQPYCKILYKRNRV